MADGAAQQSRRLLEGADARQHLDLQPLDALIPHHLVDEGRHPVDTSVTRADDADGLALKGVVDSLLGTLALGLHAAIDTHGVGA